MASVCGDHNRARIVTADYYISACRSSACSRLFPDLPIDWSAFEHSPITGIHLWFDRPITDLPHATLLDRTIQWMFNKTEGRYIQLVVSASRSLVEMPRTRSSIWRCANWPSSFPAVKERGSKKPR